MPPMPLKTRAQAFARSYPTRPLVDHPQGEGGQEETPLRDTIKKTSTEQQYGSTTQPPPAGVDEEHQPGGSHVPDTTGPVSDTNP